MKAVKAFLLMNYQCVAQKIKLFPKVSYLALTGIRYHYILIDNSINTELSERSVTVISLELYIVLNSQHQLIQLSQLTSQLH